MLVRDCSALAQVILSFLQLPPHFTQYIHLAAVEPSSVYAMRLPPQHHRPLRLYEHAVRMLPAGVSGCRLALYCASPREPQLPPTSATRGSAVSSVPCSGSLATR